MSIPRLQFKARTASKEDILRHLHVCDARFFPPLSSRLDIEQYSEKLCSKAVTFEAWSDKALVGLVAVYLNDPATLAGYVTNVSVDPDFMRQGIATVLLNNSFEYAKSIGFKTLSLEVSSRNIATRQLYGKLGFKVTQVNGDIVSMELFFR